MTVDFKNLNNHLALNHLDGLTKNEILSKEILNQFPIQFYIEREIEELLSEKILTSDNVLISGWAGSGKTSLLLFTLNKYLNNTFDTIMYFDYEDMNFNSKDIEYELLDALISHLRNHYLWENEIYEEYLYFVALTESKFDFIQCRLGIKQIINVKDLKAKDNITKNINLISNSKNREIVQEKVETFLKNRQFDNLQSLSRYLEFYLNKKTLIIYDNIDSKLLTIQQKFLEVIKNNIFNVTNTYLKSITLLRNEKLFNSISAGTNQSFKHSVCSISTFASNNKARKFSKDLFQQDNTIIYDIYMKKIDIIKDTKLKDEILGIITKLKNEEGNLKYLRLNIFKLSNHSIRFALQFINEFIFWILNNDFDINNNNATYIHSLFYAFVSNENELSIQGLNPLLVIKNVEKDGDSNGCDIDYLVLTSLINSPDDNKYPMTVSKLMSRFKITSLNISKVSLKNTLFKLSTNGNKNINLLGQYGHIVFLHNENNSEIITSIDKIEDNTTVSLMPRAKAMLLASFTFTFSNFLYLKDTEHTQHSVKYFKNYNNKIKEHIDNQYILLTRLYTVHLIELHRIYINNPSPDWLNQYKTIYGYSRNQDNKKLQLENIVFTNLLFLQELNKKNLINKKQFEEYIKKFNNLLKEFQNVCNTFSSNNIKIPNLLLEHIYNSIENNSITTKTYLNYIIKVIELESYFNDKKDFEFFIEANKKFDLKKIKNILNRNRTLRYFNE